VCGVLRAVCCVLCAVCCMLYAVCCVMCAVCCMLYAYVVCQELGDYKILINSDGGVTTSAPEEIYVNMRALV
jgi:hypothetical protein